MKKILLVAILSLSLMICLTSTGRSFFLQDDYEDGLEAFDQGNYDEAIRLLTKSIEAKPKHTFSYFTRGAAWKAKGNLDKAIADFSKVIELDPKFVDGLGYWSRGNAWYDKGNYDKAIADYTKAIEIKSTYAESYSSRGNAWYAKGDFDKAIADYTKAIEIDPKDANIYYRRGLSWYYKGDYDKAIGNYTKAIEIEPKGANVYFSRGNAWVKKGDYDKAVANFNKAIEIEPNHAYAYNSLAWLTATCPNDKYRDGKRAVAFAEKAVKLAETANNLDTLAAAYAEAGSFGEAIKTQERAIAKLKQEGRAQALPEFEKHLSSYKAGKPWREK
jgi:tetratricopeptide (TPR) repeat protein